MKKHTALLLLSILLPVILPAQKNKTQYQLVKTSGETVTPMYDYIRKFRGICTVFHMDDKTGFIDSIGNVIIPPIYDRGWETYFKNESVLLLNVKKDGKWAHANSRYEVVTPFVYDSIILRSPDMLSAKKDGYWGLIDTLGNERTPFIYDEIINYKFDFGLVEKDGSISVIYKNGTRVSPPGNDKVEFPRISTFFHNRESGLIALRINGKEGVVDSTGQVILPFIYESIGDRSEEGLYGLTLREKTFRNKAESGLIDHQGRIILEPVYEEIAVYDRCIIAMRDGQYFFFDKEGDLKLTSDKEIREYDIGCVRIEGDPLPLFYDCQGNRLQNIEKDPSRRTTYYWNLYRDKETGLCGFMDFLTGEISIAPQYDDIDYVVFDSPWRAIVIKKRKKGMIDSANNIILPIEYQEIESDDEIRYFLMKGGKWALADYDGNVFTKHEFTEIEKLDKERFALYKGKKIAISDYNGNLLTGFDFDYIDKYRADIGSKNRRALFHPFYGVVKGKRCGIYTREGKELVPCIYDYRLDDNYYFTLFEILNNGRIKMQKNGKYGLLDPDTGQELLPCEYDELTGKLFNLVLTRKGKLQGIVDMNGKEILPCIYPKGPYVLKNGVIVVNDGKREGAVDLTGKTILPMEYKSIETYHGDILLVTK